MKRSTRQFALFLVVFAGFVTFMAGFEAHAQRSQTRLPDISVPPPESQQQQGSVALNRQNFSDYEVRNPYLKTLIDLHHQIALIDTLIRWQQQVNEIKRSYAQMGVVYQTPKPPKRICGQVPANIPCYRAFPELYPDMQDTLAEFIPASLPAVEEITQQAVGDQTGNGAPTATSQDGSAEQAHQRSQQKTAQPKKVESYDPDYHWVEVFCAAGKCQAVLAHKEKSQSRMTVAVGQQLPDGSSVTSIQPSRVVLTYKNELYPLKPAPLDDTRASARPADRGENSVSREIDEMLNSFPTEATQLIPSAQQGNGGSSNGSASSSVPSGAQGSGSNVPAPSPVQNDGLPDLPGIGQTGLF